MNVFVVDVLVWPLLKQDKTPEGREELRNSINREPIYEWEGSQRDSLGPINYVTKVRLQHLPCQVQQHPLRSVIHHQHTNTVMEMYSAADYNLWYIHVFFLREFLTWWK